MKEIWQSINKFYFTNCAFVGTIILSILIMFLMQFQVEALQDEMIKTESEISAHEDEIQLLEVEWVYLTRPDRLRTLAANYLKDNGYALASQIKDVDRLEKYYLVNYQKLDDSQVALNGDAQDLNRLSF